MPAPRSISGSCCYTPSSNAVSATVSIKLDGPPGSQPRPDAGEVTVTVHYTCGQPSISVIEPVSEDMIRVLNKGAEPGKGVRGMEQAKLLLSLVGDAMISGGWKSHDHGRGPGTYLSFLPPQR